MSDLRNILKGVSEAVREISFLVKNNDFPIIQLRKEPDPEDIHIPWQPLKIIKPESGKKIIMPEISGDEHRNIKCNKCNERISGIRSFYKKGRKPVLVLTYTGETRKGHRLASKKNHNLRFRTPEADDLFARMVSRSFGLEINDFYFQEMPACNFSTDQDNDWQKIVHNCMEIVHDTIKKEGIRCVIFNGASAQLYFGNNAGEYMDKVFYIEQGGDKIPAIVSRSPESVLALEARRQKHESNKNSSEYINAKQEEVDVKKSILSQLDLIREFVNC